MLRGAKVHTEVVNSFSFRIFCVVVWRIVFFDILSCMWRKYTHEQHAAEFRREASSQSHMKYAFNNAECRKKTFVPVWMSLIV